MADEQEQIKPWKRHYRLVIKNDDTFEEVASYRLTRANVYVMASSLFVFMVLLVTIIIAFTPLRYYIPGYGDVSQRKQLLQINRTLDSLQAVSEQKDKVLFNIMRIVRGDYDYAADTSEARPKAEDPAALLAKASAEDSVLQSFKATYENEKEIGALSASSLRKNADLTNLYFVPPVSRGTVTDKFDARKGHFGIDIAAPKGTEIKATQEGVVILSQWANETGYVIGIQHKNNLVSFYKHNSTLLKKVGTFVKAGEAIAIIGNTGDLSSGPHLHFELWFDAKPVDPQDFINF